MTLDQWKRLMGISSTSANLLNRMNGVGGYWGSCANTCNFTKFPWGVDVVATTEAQADCTFPPPTRYEDRYVIHQKCLDIGAGNYLIVRGLERTDNPVHMDDEGGDKEVLPMPIKEGPPCYAAYFTSFQEAIEYGWVDELTWKRQNDAAKLAEFYKAGKQLEPCTISFLLRSREGVDQIPIFQKHFVEPLGWGDKLIYESPLFHNRGHVSYGNVLKLFVFQLKGE